MEPEKRSIFYRIHKSLNCITLDGNPVPIDDVWREFASKQALDAEWDRLGTVTQQVRLLSHSISFATVSIREIGHPA